VRPVLPGDAAGSHHHLNAPPRLNDVRTNHTTRPILESIAAELDVEPMNYRGYPILEPHYNIAPTSILPILTLEDGQPHISPMKWGLTLGAGGTS
jgi:putative SOS response-associated peptidase YedK